MRPDEHPRQRLLLGMAVALSGAILVGAVACAAGSPGAGDLGTTSRPAAGSTFSMTSAAPPATAPPATPSMDPPAESAALSPSPDAPVASPTERPASSAASSNPSALILPSSPPVSLSVPAIGIGSPLIELGRGPDGTVEVPSLDDPDSKPGWYRNSPSPGTLGPAIILGHVDSRRFGPGVFYSLKDLQIGDTVEVARADGTVAIFSIDMVLAVPKSEFPTLAVYGNLDHSGLRLITCGGEFDPDARSYESNVIVFASLVGSRSA